jgi:peptidoglycan hydrolase-like protein with peptidoglycan-binding domain
MNKITFPLKQRMQGAAVADLQDALQLLLDRSVLLRDDEAARRDISATLRTERAGQTYGDATRKLVSVFQAAHRLRPNGVVDEATAAALNAELRELGVLDETPPPLPPTPPDEEEPLPEFQHLVRGVVRYEKGLPIPGVKVEAFDIHLRRKDHLGDFITDADGLFEIFYSVEKMQSRGQRTASLLLQVVGKKDGEEKESVLTESDILFEAGIVEKVVLRVPGGPTHRWSEYEQLMSEITPLLEGSPVSSLAENEKQQELSYLSGKLGVDLKVLAQLAGSHKLAETTGMPAEVFFGLARKKLPFKLSAVLGQSAERRRTALIAAVHDLIVPGRLLDDLDKIEAQFKDLAARQAVDGLGLKQQGPWQAVIGTTGLTGDQQRLLASRFIEHKGSAPELWKSLREDPVLLDHVDEIQFTLQLGMLTAAHEPLIRRLREMRGDGVKSLRDLARFNREDWLKLVSQPDTPGGRVSFPAEIIGKDDDKKASNYAGVLTRVIEEAFPVEALAHGIQRDETTQAGTRVFFKNVLATDTPFDFARTPIAKYIAEHPALLEAVENHAALVEDLKVRQRLVKLAPTHERMTPLLKAGLTSAAAIQQTGRRAFAKQFGPMMGGTMQALKMHAQASHVVAGALNLMANAGPWFKTPTYALPETLPAVDGMPDWETLFGTFDLCRCQQCRSVQSPAAYLAELLAFLKERKVEKSLPGGLTLPTNVRDLLYARRPDLGDIELTCVNTNVALPYIDLACEVLENAVRPFTPFVLPAAVAADLDTRTLSQAIGDAFIAAGHVLATDPSIVVVQAAAAWLVTDHRRLYSIQHDAAAGQPRVVALGYQTFGTEAELAANPSHVNTDAYADLQAAVYPWTLPLDLWTEETRVWLQKAGVERVELMRVFQPQQAPVDPSDRAIACETLGLTKKEMESITATEAAPHQPWEFWGLAQAGNLVEIPDPADPSATIISALGWVETLSHVRPFLKQSGITYDELLRLLATRLINPTGIIRIESVDPGDPATCDTQKLHITNLNASVLDRIHRFVRLRRRLSWTIRELDLAVQVFQGDVADPNDRLAPRLIEQLAAAHQLHKEFDISLERLFTLWGGIDTRRGSRDDPDGEDSLYDQLFLNPAVLKPVDAAFTLNAARDDLAQVGQQIASHVPGVLGGLGITAAELTELMASEAPAPSLNLANLSALFRRAILSLGMGVPVGECIRWKSLCGVDPFAAAHPEDTLEFVRAVRQIVEAGFTLNEVDYLLRHQQPPGDPLTPAVETVAQVLTEMRDELQTMQDGLIIETDLNGEVTRKFLGLLKWDPAQVELVVATLNSQPAFVAPLAALPAGTVFPPAVAPRVAWDASRRVLTFAGVMTALDKAALDGVVVPTVNQASYQASIDELQLKSDTILDAVRAFERPVFRTPLAQASMPAGGLISRRLKGRFFFDRQAGDLCFSGLMLGQDWTELTQIQGADAAFKNAVDQLQTLSEQFVPAGSNEFLNEAEVTALLAAGKVPPERFRGVLENLVPRLRRLLGESLVKQKLSEALGAEPVVLAHLMDAGTMDHFLAPEFAESHASLVIDATRFPVLFDTFTRLSKGMLTATKLRFNARQMDWYSRFLPDVPPRTVRWTLAVPAQAGWLDLRALPLAQNANSVPALMSGLCRLIGLCQVRDQIRGNGELALEEILLAARKPALAANNAALTNEVAAILKRRAGWEETDTVVLIGLAGLALSLPVGLQDETGPALLVRCHSLARRINAGAARAVAWAREAATAATGLEIKQALRARLGDEAWQKFSAPAQDLLREKKRAALVAYLTVRPVMLTKPDGSSTAAWHDTNGLFAHFLIDIEMCACWKTSRIKQALSSVQLFVQRCLLHLESGVRIDISKDDAWRDWKWMKNYRVWEANRKVFLYPENWIEPEMRDDKTPFFKDFENELLQNELTAATAENAFLRYLEKLDAVAKLELIGMYEQEAADGLQSVLHVFGRTQATPAVYYYRRRTGSGRWTPWEKVDLDIEGDHVIPIIWNRRLYLFWAVFGIKAKSSIPAKDTAGPPPTKYFEIQLAWSEYKQGKWLPKRITRQRVTTAVPVTDNPDDDGRNRHVFFTSINADGLRIWPEWDNPTSSYSDLVKSAYGDTLEIPRTTNHATVGTFFFSGCSSDAVIESGREIHGVFNPTGSHVNGTRFEEGNVITVPIPFGQVELPLPWPTLHLPVDGTSNREEVAFKATPGSADYQLLYPHQDYYLAGKRPFFFEDQARAFVVQPGDTTPLQINWQVADMVDPGKYKLVVNHYYAVKNPGIKAMLADAGNAAAGVEPAASSGIVLEVENLKTKRLRDNINIVAPYLEVDKVLAPGGIMPALRWERRYRFYPFYHPYLCEFIKELNRGGVDTLMTLAMQGQNRDYFKDTYQPTGLVHRSYPIDNVDFAPTGSYSQYNWELFFHAPMMIATRLTQNQRFDEARQWFHYIFDPTNASSEDAPRKFWRTKPFHDLEREDYLKQRIEQLLKPTASGTASSQLAMQIAEWRQNPFSPYAIARLRLTAFQKSVVMKYLDCLIAWGDQLFRRDTIESINEATQLYILAADLLGERPTEIAPRAEAQVQTYNSLDPLLSSFSNRLVEIEYLIAVPSADAVLVPSGAATMPIPKIPYFCVPRNDKLMGYWDTVADRLFKIRHCMNIEGVVRQLALFEPPIDPALLVRAAVAGVDLGSVLNDLNAPLPCYRFQVMAQKATELCSEVKALGAALLSSLEKRDSEALSLLRSSQELDMLKAVREVRQQQHKEAAENLAALENGKLVTEARRDFYKNIVRINQNEQLNLNKLASAHDWQTKAQIAELVAAVVPLIGDFDIGASGWAGSPVVKWRWGGVNIGMAAQAAARGMNFLAFLDQYDASTASIKGGFDRRWDEWKHQENLAKLELKQVDKSIEAAKIRLAIAEKELANHDQQTTNAKALDEMMRTKFTNRELYDWMVAQVSALYFQSYQLAYDVAKRAERAFRHELGVKESNFIQFGYWDSLKKGLLAGEQQFRDLKRMEVAYLEQNKREHEITKHISLDLLHPQALVALRQSGSCFFELPEAIFDIDHPGHYLRRIKSVSLSLPCVVGPYTSVSAQLTLLGNRIRRDTQVQAQYAWHGIEDPRFAHDVGGIQSIVTSTGQQDSGVFELNFRDDRYLPFEGAGVISSWRLELPKDFRQFDYNTISDAVLHVRYTARDGGETLKAAVTTKLLDALRLMQVEQGKSGLFRLFSLRHDFPNQWHHFLHSQPVNGESPKLNLELKSDLFPAYARDKTIKLKRLLLLIKTKKPTNYDVNDPLAFAVTRPSGGPSAPLEAQGLPGELEAAAPATLDLGAGVSVTDDSSQTLWTFLPSQIPLVLRQIVNTTDGPVQVIDPETVEDLGVLCRYTVE